MVYAIALWTWRALSASIFLAFIAALLFAA